MTSPPNRPKGIPSPPKVGHLPRKCEKMQSHQIKLKLGKETKFGTRISKIRVLKIENNRKLGKRPPNWPQAPKNQSHQIKMKIGKETKFATINLNIRVLKLGNNRKMGYWPPKMTPGTPKWNGLKISTGTNQSTRILKISFAKHNRNPTPQDGE